MRLVRSLIVAGVMLATSPVAAEDILFDATDPAQVASALQAAGYKAEIKKEDGDPYILSAANGETFTLDFYDCTNGKCTSFQFASFYKAEPLWTPQLANEWNAANRFLKVAVDDQGRLRENIYVSGVGKLTQANFADLVDWYQSMDALLVKFIDKKRAAATPKPAAK